MTSVSSFVLFSAVQLCTNQHLVLLGTIYIGTWPTHYAVYHCITLMHGRVQQLCNEPYEYKVALYVVDRFSRVFYIREVNLVCPNIVISFRSRTVTRGVNKGVKEDFKAAMDRQVARTEENISLLLRTFIVDEADFLTKSLL